MNYIIAGSVITTFFLVAYLINKYSDLKNSQDIDNLNVNDFCLEKDFNNIIELIPMLEIKKILDDYFKYDKQMSTTYNFINEQKKFIIQEIKSIPETMMLLKILQHLGVNLENLNNTIINTWLSLPEFEESNSCIASGGLTVMINKILLILPQDELHFLLRDKLTSSKSFKILIQLLKSPLFIDFCVKIKNNAVLNRHYYWANQDGIEAMCAIELLKKLYLYLTQRLAGA
ncbi:hypothetical protein HCN44_000973 [Aphidius gifuensis]|uniref:Uncharacterized protein n=1 Tax=Aphidius gifuensis TaxID=684658 RepID=A0A835CPT1_APHGI|nr:uncharacterized protein LOC122856715 [Aphidius gifuensis]XP_044014434.1 uncharacterized protein LOC122856715 [Aphidius gifuensis]KAF7988400.1 hypothetical protein HCN44_000973 [Aphidius gifuensis]